MDIGEGRSYVFRDDMVLPTQAYVDAVLARMEEYTLAGATSVQLMVEQRVPIDHLTGETDASGTADAVIVVLWADGTALVDVGDLKFGRGVEVSAIENKQLQLYALGTIKMLDAVTEFDRVRMTIYQPRVSDKPSDWEITLDELMAFGETVKIAAALSLQVYDFEQAELTPHLRPSVDACRWCKRKADCPAIDRAVLDATGAEDFTDFPDDAADALQLSLDYQSDLLSQKMAACDLIETWIKAVRAEVERCLLQGAPVPGYKLVLGRQGARAWSDKESAETYLKSKVRLKVEEMYLTTMISPTQAEKLVAAKAKGDRGIGPDQWTALQSFIGRSPAGKSVAPMSDKRPAIVVGDGADDFEIDGGAIPEENFA